MEPKPGIGVAGHRRSGRALPVGRVHVERPATVKVSERRLVFLIAANLGVDVTRDGELGIEVRRAAERIEAAEVCVTMVLTSVSI